MLTGRNSAGPGGDPPEPPRHTASSGDTIQGPGGPGSQQDESHGTAGDTPRQAAWARWFAGRTLRARLIAGLLVIFTLASVGVGVATTIAFQSFQVRQLDQQLFSAARDFSAAIERSQAESEQPGTSGCPRNTAPEDGPRLTSGQEVGTYAARFVAGQLSYSCEVVDKNGVSLANIPLSGADLAALASVPLSAPTGWRAYSRQLSGPGEYRLTAFRGGSGDIHLVGLPLSGVEASVHRLEVIELVVFGAALLVMGIAGTGWIRLSLRPLGRVTATAAEVAELPLESGEVTLPHRVPDADPRTEVGKLGKAFNQMLGHVERSLATRQASEARLRQFVADASHELRTPLAGIRGYTEFAMRATGMVDPEVRRALGRVDAESARMSRLVDDLLLLARLDAGRPLANEQVDLTRLAIDATNDARVADPGHRWVLDLPDEPVVITGDQHRLHQVIANLLTNARTHTPAGTTVTVRLMPNAPATNGRGVELTVSDDGPGIPAELQANVWERFAKGDSTRSRKAGSTGLGLAIVQAVVTAHHGRVSVTSHPGKTTFSIWLPARGGQAQA
ncbi:MAG: sensor histidine kinase [Micromonosporaceae bacterium]